MRWKLYADRDLPVAIAEPGESRTDVDSLEQVQDFTALFGFPYLVDTQTDAKSESLEPAPASTSTPWY